MKKKIGTNAFKGTAEQEAQLRAVIEANKDDSSKLIAVMQQAQDIYGYLPLEVQKIIAEGMGVSAEKVYGVSTSMHSFLWHPRVNTIFLFASEQLATLRAQAIFSIA